MWSAASIQLLVDDVVYYTLPNSSAFPFNQNFFIILNLAMGGNFGGAVDTAFSTRPAGNRLCKGLPVILCI
ncbi:hypothetical protein ACQ86N_22020 [Puia sp. P3]|uniref:hypothetical protein n=1 Tax=Puia sp. P3 TaxID=3423952 RepID=UPI003D66FC2B